VGGATLITGSADWTNQGAIAQVLIPAGQNGDTIITRGAPTGADRMVHALAQSLPTVQATPMPARERDGERAQRISNRMLLATAEITKAIIFVRNGHVDEEHLIRLLRKQGIPTEVYRHEDLPPEEEHRGSHVAA